MKVAKAWSGCLLPPCPHQGAFQVEGLRILTQQHDVLLQVVEATVLVVADALLQVGGGRSSLTWGPCLLPGDAVGDSLS